MMTDIQALSQKYKTIDNTEGMRVVVVTIYKIAINMSVLLQLIVSYYSVPLGMTVLSRVTWRRLKMAESFLVHESTIKISMINILYINNKLASIPLLSSTTVLQNFDKLQIKVVKLPTTKNIIL